MKIKNIFKLRKGITVAELITALSIMVITGMIAISVMTLSLQGERLTSIEFRLQTDTRVLLDQVTHNIRYATAIFILPENSFNSTSININLDFIPFSAAGFLSERWNYFGNIDGIVVRYIWGYHPTYGYGHRRVELFNGFEEALDFDLRFAQIDPLDMNDTLVEFQLRITESGSAAPIKNILTAADSLNAMQVVDLSTGLLDLNPGRALAYRMDDLPRDIPIARVVLILDVSGSMRMGLGGGVQLANAHNNPASRIWMLRRATEDVIDTFSEIANIYLTIIPYSTTANFGFPHAVTSLGDALAMHDAMYYLFNGEYGFHSVHENKSAFDQIAGTLFATGGTNIGDSLRRAYHALRIAAETPDPYGREVREYVILMTDGEPNMASMNVFSSPHTWVSEMSLGPPFYLGTGDTQNSMWARYLTAGLWVNQELDIGNVYFPLVTGADTFTGEFSAANVAAGTAVIRTDHSIVNDVVTVPAVYTNIIYPYMEMWADAIRGRDNLVRTDFVAFSSTVVGASGNLIGRANDVAYLLGLGSGEFYAAAEMQDLMDAFEDIANTIILDLWHAAGPNIVPPVGGP